MRLLLDEQYGAQIAAELRRRGHDVIAVVERPDLIGRDDRVQFAALAEQRRATLTEDVGDYRPLLQAMVHAQQPTYGLVCVNPRRFPRRQGEVGRLVRALDAFLRAHPADEDLMRRGGEAWLGDP